MQQWDKATGLKWNTGVSDIRLNLIQVLCHAALQQRRLAKKLLYAPLRSRDREKVKCRSKLMRKSERRVLASFGSPSFALLSGRRVSWLSFCLLKKHMSQIGKL